MYLYTRDDFDQIPMLLQPRTLTLRQGFGQPPPVDPGILRTPPRIDPGIVQTPPGTVDPLDVVNYLLTEAEIKRQLERNFRADDVAGFLDRRRKLRQAFGAVPKSFAQHLFGRLLNKNDPLAKLFRYKLATPTRNEMISILLKKSSETI